ncbi:MAG: hypothetical protein ABI234_07535 [Ktedonobacteraceae bacterium]
MLYRQRWMLVLVLTLVLTFVSSPRAFALSGASAVVKCTYGPSNVNNPIPTVNTGPTLMVLNNQWRSTAYFCGVGYLGYRVDNVNEVYNNAGGPAWFKWYRNGVGHYCAFSGIGGYQNFDPPVGITQIDYGDEHTSDDCGD